MKKRCLKKQYRKILKIIYKVFLAFTIFVLMINVFSALNLSFFGFRVYRVGSGSMEPYLHLNDFVLIKKKDNYELDDIVTYKSNQIYVTHRIVKISDSQIITKGDANNIDDAPITKELVIGKLIYKFKTLGFFNYLFSRKMTWILLFVLGISITIMIPDKRWNFKERS